MDALTIDQTVACECLEGNSPVVLTSDGREPLIYGGKKGYVDLQVVHPPVTLVNGRPRWLAEAPDRRAVLVALPAHLINKKSLVQVFDKKEFDAIGMRAIPVDQLLTDGSQREVTMLVPVGVARTVIIRKPFE